MAKKPREKDIERKVCEAAESVGCLVYKFISPGVRGVPDRIFMYHGRVIFVEFKTAFGTLSHHQDRQATILRAHGMIVHIISSVLEGNNLIEEFTGLTP